MINRIKFKRLDYKYVDIATQKFDGMNLFIEDKNIEFKPIEKFISETSKEKLAEIFNYEKGFRQRNCGLGDNFTDEVKKKKNSGAYINVRKDSDKVSNVFLNFNVSKGNNVVYDQNFINVEDGAKVKIFVYYDYDSSIAKEAGEEVFRNGIMALRAGKESQVEFIKVQNLPHSAINFSTTNFYIMEKSKFKFYDIQLGSKKTGCSTTTFIPEQSTKAELYPLYFSDKERRFDLEHNFIIDGKLANGIISATGALKNSAYKIFRGNIFLNKGCSQTFARFSDSTVMLDKKTTSLSIPTIFCDEDDVVGEHASSFEAVNKAKLYYLMTRGFDELSAKKLIIEANFKPVFNMIDDEEIKEKLIAEFNESLDDLS